MDNSLLAVRDINHKHIVVDWSSFVGASWFARPAWAQSNWCGFVKCLDSGKFTANDKGVRCEMASRESRMANHWFDGQKSHKKHGISDKFARQTEVQLLLEGILCKCGRWMEEKIVCLNWRGLHGMFCRVMNRFTA